MCEESYFYENENIHYTQKNSTIFIYIFNIPHSILYKIYIIIIINKKINNNKTTTNKQQNNYKIIIIDLE